MYEGPKVTPIIPAIAGPAVILPNTGGSTILTVIALTSIVVGTAIIVSTIVRMAAARAYKA